MKNNTLGQRIVKYKHFYFFEAPFLLFFVVFMLLPVLYSFYISLNNWSDIHSQFIGFNNYKMLIHDDVDDSPMPDTRRRRRSAVTTSCSADWQYRYSDATAGASGWFEGEVRSG